MTADSLRILRSTAVVAVAAGAIGSVGLTLYAGQRIGAPRLLQALFAIWVLSPFVLLGVGYRVSSHWSEITRATLYAVTLVVTAGSLIIYGTAALGPSRPRTPPFVMMAPASWLMIAIVIGTAAFASRGSSH